MKNKFLNGITTIIVIVFGIFVVTFFSEFGKFMGNKYSLGKNDEYVDTTLMNASSKINATLPIMIDSETRWDNTIPGNKSFRYNYTLVNYPASIFTAEEINLRFPVVLPRGSN